MRTRLGWMLLGVTLSFGWPAAPLQGQLATPAMDAPTAAIGSVADRLRLPPSAGHLLIAGRPAKTDPAELVAVRRASSRGSALAIVGGALFVGGLVAGGDAGTLMVLAGAGIGGYGLYLMLSP